MKINSQIGILKILVISSAISMFLLFGRIAFSFSLTYTFLAWNLILAWAPLVPAILFYNKHPGGLKRNLSILVFFCCWLLFFPNSPYIITDLFHFRTRPGIPAWFDLVLLMSFLWNALMVGYVSLMFVHQKIFILVRRKILANLIVYFILFLTAYGVYLGRYERWNSWDVFLNPMILLFEICSPVVHPFSNIKSIGFTGIFGLFLISAYSILNAMIVAFNPRFSQLKKE